jgi:hypothetical protein
MTTKLYDVYLHLRANDDEKGEALLVLAEDESAEMIGVAEDLASEYKARIAELEAALRDTLEWWVEVYPDDIFIGKSDDADEGVKRVAELRAKMRAALGEA